MSGKYSLSCGGVSSAGAVETLASVLERRSCQFDARFRFDHSLARSLLSDEGWALVVPMTTGVVLGGGSWCGCRGCLLGREAVAVAGRGQQPRADSRLGLVGRSLSGGYGSETGPLAVSVYWIAVWALVFAPGWAFDGHLPLTSSYTALRVKLILPEPVIR